MRMFIPEIGTKLVLSAPWEIMIRKENRNESVYGLLAAACPEGEMAARAIERDRLLDSMSGIPSRSYMPGFDQARIDGILARVELAEALPLVLPLGTQLTVDRIYIRKGISAYSSLSFHLTKTDHPLLNRKARKRFWVKLDEVNKMQFELAAVRQRAA